MKALFFAVALGTTLTLSGMGFFVPQTQGMENTVAGMVVLSNAEMAGHPGGYGQWRSEQTRSATGSFANCAARPCRTWEHSRTYGHYRCAPCEGTESTWTRVSATKVEKSRCKSYTMPDRCRYDSNVTSYQWSCVSYTGNCGDHTW